MHMDCLHWVNRDSYLPQGSRGLKVCGWGAHMSLQHASFAVVVFAAAVGLLLPWWCGMLLRQLLLLRCCCPAACFAPQLPRHIVFAFPHPPRW